MEEELQEQEHQEQKQLSPAEIYNQRQRKIADEMNNPVPKIGDKVFVDIDYVGNGTPNPTLKARIMGINIHGQYYVRLSTAGGPCVYVYPEATKLRYD